MEWVIHRSQGWWLDSSLLLPTCHSAPGLVTEPQTAPDGINSANLAKTLERTLGKSIILM